jgi:hypothetical protein
MKILSKTAAREICFQACPWEHMENSDNGREATLASQGLEGTTIAEIIYSHANVELGGALREYAEAKLCQHTSHSKYDLFSFSDGSAIIEYATSFEIVQFSQ